MTLAIVVPCYNEVAVIEPFYVELARTLDAVEGLDWFVCFIDDGSTDATLERLNAVARTDRRVRVYSLSRNFGHQIALSAGLDVTRGVRPQSGHYRPTGVHTAAMCLICDAGRVDAITVPAAVSGHSRVFFLKITARPGDVILRPPEGNTIVGFLGTTGSSFEESMV